MDIQARLSGEAEVSFATMPAWQSARPSSRRARIRRQAEETRMDWLVP